MHKSFSIIILLMMSALINGCNTQRGGFGGAGTGIDTDDVFIADSIKKIDTDPPQTTIAPYNSLTEASADANTTNENKALTLQALAVQGNETTNYTASGEFGWSQDGETIINVATITLPAVSLTFDGAGNISG
ncbi:MAG: hypothetical protein K0U45_05530, partial [Alphaproteobacteria bacterium]|nr:hypothetical protein [Alphaproteobacteria bacterium]